MDNIYTPFELHQLLLATATDARTQLEANPVLADHEFSGDGSHPPINPTSAGK